MDYVGDIKTDLARGFQTDETPDASSVDCVILWQSDEYILCHSVKVSSNVRYIPLAQPLLNRRCLKEIIKRIYK